MRNDKLKINFNAGPGALPKQVLEQASQAILEYENTGMSILGIPHRGKYFEAIIEESKQLVKELCGLTDEYEVMWMQGGGRMQFAMIPMNFLDESATAGYLDSGFWAKEAYEYARYYGNAHTLSSSETVHYIHLPQWPEKIDGQHAYIHFTTNNTIYGTQWQSIPQCNRPLIADMSSDIFSRKMDYAHCSLFYAVAQKNIGPAGATLVVARKDFLDTQVRKLPSMLSYKEHAKKNSVLNTPPVFAIYASLLNLRWLKENGMEAIEKVNNEKAQMLYREIDRNTLFHTVVREEHRSKMNACFRMADENLLQPFLAYCEQQGITGIAGHRSVGGLRVSLYNAISVADVAYLTDVMQAFEKIHSK